MYIQDLFQPAVAALLSLRDIASRMQWSLGSTESTLYSVLQLVAAVSVAGLAFVFISARLERLLLKKVGGSDRHLTTILVAIARIGLFIAFAAFLGPLMGLDTGLLSALGAAVGVGVGLAVRHLTTGLASGAILLAERVVKEGDQVKVGTSEGRLLEITPRYTVLKTGAGRMHIPNQQLVEGRVESMTLTDRLIKLTTQLRLSQDAPLEELRTALLDATLKVEAVIADPEPALLITDFPQGLVEVTIEFWTDKPERGVASIVSAVNLEVLLALRRAGVRPAPVSRSIEVARTAERNCPAAHS